MNKLTEENYEKLYPKILDYCQNPRLIEGIIKIIFEKAIVEPKFSKMYARLCHQLVRNVNVTVAEIVGTKASEEQSKTDKDKKYFKMKLLDRCQATFENK